ncbi:STN domain-containing protein [Variovorax sp. ZS18.2.2]|uniref:STN domain-containing protein n=1 Tax=Variovorax sp. ZS18.2.2 TaxID=2971255 RepID=UPI002151E518|nr:STN domain-containing protein [Variovorax sp. ZS18.2.2]MCR6476355.1 STN domain-containing protein [Variovorax sp. ZS18.2.2]
MSFIAHTASAQQAEAATAPATRMEFDIAAQRLGDAIAAYGKATGLDVLIDGVHAQRLSGTVRGTFTAMEALEAMLAGTGLEARHASATSVVIRASRTAGGTALQPMPEAEGMEESGFKEGEVLHQSYAAQVQRALNGTLCASTQTRPGSYRLALQLHVDARGVVDRFRLLSTTGVSDRDAAIQIRLRGLSVGSPPPPSLPQPLVILMLPEGPGAWSDCEASNATDTNRRMQ